MWTSWHDCREHSAVALGFGSAKIYTAKYFGQQFDNQQFVFVFRGNSCQVTHLEGFHESPEQRADALSATQQFYQPHDSEQTAEVDAEEVALI